MAVAGNVGHGIRGQGSSRQIAALAARQHGVVSRAQLLALGLGQGAIDHRVVRGLLHPVHRGVYAVGHSVLGPRGQWLAAVLAAGPGAVLSHSSAAALWGIRDAARARPEVTVARRRRLTSVTTHRIALAEDEITINDGIPVTTPARTLVDLAEQLTPQRLERAVHEAEYRRLTSPLSVDALLTRHPKRRGDSGTEDDPEPQRPRPHPHQDRARDRVPRLPRRPPHRTTQGQRADRPLHRRRPVARAAPDRRARQPPSPLHHEGLRGRPRPRPRPTHERLPSPPHHLAPPPRRRAHHRDSAPSPTRLTTTPPARHVPEAPRSPAGASTPPAAG
jgi:hypothetical protein